MSESAGDAAVRVEFAGELRRVEHRAGDRFVLTCAAVLSADMHERIGELWKTYWTDRPGPAPPLLILDKGFALGVVRAEEQADG